MIHLHNIVGDGGAAGRGSGCRWTQPGDPGAEKLQETSLPVFLPVFLHDVHLKRGVEKRCSTVGESPSAQADSSRCILSGSAVQPL